MLPVVLTILRNAVRGMFGLGERDWLRLIVVMLVRHGLWVKDSGWTGCVRYGWLLHKRGGSDVLRLSML
jgi:hypothetical protein